MTKLHHASSARRLHVISASVGLVQARTVAMERRRCTVPE